MPAPKPTPKQPLAEVFGFSVGDTSAAAVRHRSKRLCPFNNKVPNCTKDKAQDPLGVCSVFHNGAATITCPVRFRQDWIIADDAAEFFFPPETRWTTLTEVRLKDAGGQSAGNIDVVLCAYDDKGRVQDFGALEVQAVYISGNVRNAFEHYMADPTKRHSMDWTLEANYPRPDYLSSSRKRLAPQLIFKGGILHAWRKKSAVALHRAFYETLPTLPEVDPKDAEIAWLIYDVKTPSPGAQYEMFLEKKIYTKRPAAPAEIELGLGPPIEQFARWIESELYQMAV